MIDAIIIMLSLYGIPISLFLLIKNYRKIDKAIVRFLMHKEIKFLFLSIIKFLINLGASVTAVSAVGMFIPQKVGDVVLIKMAIFGIILSIGGYYIQRSMK